jgi:hypothetical protein
MSETLNTAPGAAHLAKIAQAKDEALRELAASHGERHAEFKTLGERIRMLWSLPVQRAVLLGLLLDAVDQKAAAWRDDMRWDGLFACITDPKGNRPYVPKGEMAGPSRDSRDGPFCLADLDVIQAHRGDRFIGLAALATRSERDDSLDFVFDQQAPKRRSAAPSFLGVRSGEEDRPVTQRELAAALCFFAGDSVKKHMQAFFDNVVPDSWPPKPKGVSDAEWGLTIDERREQISQAVERRAELLAEMRELDQQMSKIDREHELGKLALWRIQSADDAY